MDESNCLLKEDSVVYRRWSWGAKTIPTQLLLKKWHKIVSDESDRLLVIDILVGDSIGKAVALITTMILACPIIR